MLGLRINGQTVYRPGGYSKYSVAVIGGVDPASVGIVQLIGEADEGASGYQEFGSPADALAAYGSGALARDALIAFQPFDDADIPGGAFRLGCYKTNAGTQAATTLPMATAAGIPYVTDAGSSTTSLVFPALTFTVNAEIGHWVLVGTEKRRIIANSTTTLTLPTTTPLSVAPPITTTCYILANSLTLASKKYGLRGNRMGVEFEPSATPRKYVLTLTEDAATEPSPLLGGDPVLRVMYVGGTVPALSVSGTATGPIVGTPSATLVNVTLANVPGANALVGKVIQLPGGLQRLIASHTNAAAPCAITLDTAHAITAAQAAACVGGTATVRNSISALVSIGNLTFVSSTTLAGDSITLTYASLGMTTLRHLVNYLNANTNFLAVVADGVNADTTLLANMDWGAATYSNNGTVDTRFDFGVEDVELSSAATAATATAGSAGPWNITTGWTIITTTEVDNGTAIFTAKTAASVLGVAAGFGDFTGTTGLSFVVNGGTAQPMNLTAAVLTVDDVVAQINAAGITGVFAANVGAQVKVTTDLKGTAATIAISGTGYVKAFGAAPTVTAGLGNVDTLSATTAAEVATIIDAAVSAHGASCALVGGVPTIVRSLPGSVGTLTITGTAAATINFSVVAGTNATDSSAYYCVPASVWSPNPLRRSRFFQDVAQLVAYVNASSNLATAARSAVSGADTHNGSYLPAVTGGVYSVERDVVVYCVGGTRGTSTNTNWQTGFDLLKTKRSNSIVPCLSADLVNDGYGSTATFDSVMAMVKAHIIARNANGRNEAAAYVGRNGTKTQLMALGRYFSSQNVHVVGQNLTYPDVDATNVVMDAHAFATACAGGRAGSKEVGTPLMWKTLRASAVTQDPSWTPVDDDDFNDLTIAGVMMCADSAETAEQNGIYVLYDRTSYTQDAENDLFNDGNMAEELRFFIWDFRTRWAAALGGNKVDNTGGAGAASPSKTSAYAVAVPILDGYKVAPFNIMFNTEYPENSGKFIPGWDQLAVRVAGNTTYGTVRVAFAPGTVYVVPEIQAIATVNAAA